MSKIERLLKKLMSHPDIIFDLDNTLFPMSDYDRGAFSDIAMLFPDAKGLAEFLFLQKKQQGARYARLFNDAVDAFKLTPAAVSEMVRLYHMHDARFVSMNHNYLSLLQQLKSDDHRLFLVSNGRLSTQQKKIDKLGIAGFFTEIEICDGSSKHPLKPNPSAFFRLTHHYRLENAVMVGDSVEIDGEFAKNSGIPFTHHFFVEE